MKKVLLVISAFFVLLTCANAQNFKIDDYKITTNGKYKLTTTKPYAIQLNYPIDKKSIFNKHDFESYLTNYKQELENSRLFEEINVDYEVLEQTVTSDDNPETLLKVKLNINVTDSNHFLMVPYPKFKSDKDKTEIILKLKAKDSNFLGTMNPLATDLNIEVKKDEESWSFKPGFNISYDYPFSAGPFDATWINDYSINYNSQNKYPEWNAKTGLKFVLPFHYISFVFEGYHNFINNFDYEKYGDAMYSKEEFKFSTPIKLYEFKNFSYLTYTPSLSYNFYWDQDGINIDNPSLTGPIITLNQSLSNSKINWHDNFRKGYSISLGNSWTYNFQRKDWSPSISLEAKGFTSIKLEDRDYLDQIGIVTDIYAFTYFDMPGSYYDHDFSGYGDSIGSRLRGVPDDSYFGNFDSDTTSTGFVLNIDLPINIIRTSFERDLFNFNMQFSPFLDIAIYRDRALPLQTDSKICSGMEVLVYPKKWSSFIIRGSIGFDLKETFAEDTNIKGLVKGLWHNKEISIGLGLHY